MDWGEIKTSWYAGLGKTAEEIRPFDFQDTIDQAQLHLASLIPAHLVTRLVKTDGLTVAGSAPQVGASYAILPEMIELLGVRWNITAGEVLREARLVGPSEFQNTWDNTDDNICMIDEGRLVMNKVADELIVTYKDVPDSYMDKSLSFQDYITVDVEYVDSSTIRCKTVMTVATDFTNSSDLASFVGGKCRIFYESGLGDPFVHHTIGTTGFMVEHTIVRIFDQDNGSGTDVAHFELSPATVLPDLGTRGDLATFVNVPQGSSYSEPGATERPDIDARWHKLMVDYAVILTHLRYGKAELASALTQKFNSDLALAGVKLGGAQ